MLVSFIFLLFLQCVTADFVDHLSAEDRTDFEKLDAETDLTENQLLDNIGDWAKEKGLQVMSRPSVNVFNDGRTVPGNVVRLDVYMEAQCPDTSRFVRAQLMPAWKKLSQTGRVDWNLIPFGKARCVEREGGDFDCTCQHGPNECILNQLMNCVIETIQHPDRTASLSPRMTFVPWIMLNGERVVDALYDLPGNLCKQLEPAPVACS